MLKPALIIVLSLFILKTAFAQKKDTVVYYLNDTGRPVESKANADYFLIILPPDTSVDKNLFIVKEYYKNGKIRLIGNSKTNDLNLQFEGSQIAFFPNGHKMRITNFKDGESLGDIIEYYPNGKLYNVTTRINAQKVILKQCNDTSGIVIAENGNGQWINFLDETFKGVYVKGEVKNGIEEGEWQGELDNVYFTWVFLNGKLLSSSYKNKPDAEKTDMVKTADGQVFTLVEHVPEFAGGIEAFIHFLSKNIRYPEKARDKDIQGRVLVSFIVETDGKLTDIKVAKGIGGGCDEEALRVMQLSPPWRPGIQGRRTMRVAYSVPISFTLSN
jgi:TonB family protein